MVPITPKLGTNFHVFPLESVRIRFQMMRKFLGYRNPVSQGGMEPLDSECFSPHPPPLPHVVSREPQDDRLYLFS
jgi:hypothetical protein